MLSQSPVKLVCVLKFTACLGGAFGAPADIDVVSIRDTPSAPLSMSLLFLGYQENNHHSPSAVFSTLAPIFVTEGVDSTFTNSLSSISNENLATYDALMMYGNANSSGAGSPNQPLVPIIQQFVEKGGALVGLHVASAAFRNDLRFGALLGGRFQSHTVGAFTPENIEPDHSLIIGLTPLTSFDETYILKDLNPDINVLQERVTNTGIRHAWTWTRSQGRGRVFYTASGHVPANGDTSLYDSITKPEFAELALRGLHWSVRRHFSSFSGISLGTGTSLWGEGTHRPTGQDCLWKDSGSGPTLAMVQGDAISISGETYFFGPIDENSTIACDGSTTDAVTYRSIISQTNQISSGLWHLKPSREVQPLILTGQPFPSATSPEIVDDVGQIIGEGFVATSKGSSLYRARLKNLNTMTERTIIATSDHGIALSEGDTTPGNPSLTIGNLECGHLSLNESGNFACEISLMDGSTAIAINNNGSLLIEAIEGQEVPGLTGVLWGSPQHLSLTDANELYFTTTLTGDVNENNNSALVRYSLSSQQTVIILREGDEIMESGFAGDLSAREFVADQSSHCHLFVNINGPLITTANDQVLLSVGDTTKVILQEGANLPTFEPGSSIGAELGNTPLLSDGDGSLYFIADVINNGNASVQLFQAIGTTVFGVLGAGEVVSNDVGTTFEITSIVPFNRSSREGGLPSPVKNDCLVVVANTSSGHEIVIKMSNLHDLDQDGFPNLLEAGLGSDPYEPSVNHALLPTIEVKNGNRFYTFFRATGSGLPIPTIEESVNLVDWAPSTAELGLWEDQTTAPPGFEKLSWAFDETSEYKFLRLSF